jgi:hypothetical protein
MIGRSIQFVTSNLYFAPLIIFPFSPLFGRDEGDGARIP